MTSKTEFKDLQRLAKDRVRDSALSVAQLIDEDVAKAALLVAVAADLIDGAAFFIQAADKRMTDEEAKAGAVLMVMRVFGVKSLAKVLQVIQEKERCSG